VATWLEKLIGPRVSSELLAKERKKFQKPTIFLGLAAFLLLVSIFLPYWRLKLLAPQYPQGLYVRVYINRVVGDVREIDELNHYIGMRSLQDAAQLERSLSVFAIVVISLLTLGAIYVHNQFAAVLSLPALLFPLIFLGDLYYWLWNYGTHLDPRAPLSGAIKPFVPPLLGVGKIGQFRTIAYWDIGLWLAILASLLIVIGLYYHRKAYKPLVDAMK